MDKQKPMSNAAPEMQIMPQQDARPEGKIPEPPAGFPAAPGKNGKGTALMPEMQGKPGKPGNPGKPGKSGKPGKPGKSGPIPGGAFPPQGDEEDEDLFSEFSGPDSMPPPPGVMVGGKVKDMKGTILKLLGYCSKYIPLFLISLVAAVLGNIFNLVGPDKLSEITDLISEGITGTIDLNAVSKIAGLLVALYVAGAVLNLIQGWIMASVTQWVSKRLRTDISEKINRLPLGYFNGTTTGDVLSRVTNDVDTIGMSLSQSISTLFSALTLLVGSLFMMLITNLIMTFTAIAASIIGFVLMALIMSKSQKYFVLQQRHLGKINGHIEEIFSGHTVVKSYNGEDEANRVFDEMNANLQESAFKAQALSGLMMPIMAFIGNFGYVLVCIVGAALTISGKITFGVIIAFIMYVRYFTEPLSQFAQVAQSMQSAAAAGERVFEFLELEEMPDESEKKEVLTQVRGDVEFRHVRFGYDESRDIIHDFSAKAKAGQKIAIVGPTGAGKTTMVNLLMRFYEVNGGEILIDGIPTSRLRRENVHGQFCMVLQDTWLFEGTVRENLVYCTENITDDQLEEACKAVGLDYFVHTLSKGFDTVLNDQVTMSQGQKQQLTIARAMIADKPMLILDEATSSVDTRTELQIQHAMDRLMENRTSFVIAHRLSTIRDADLILVMREGDIVESGTHDELLKQNGFYAELYNSQFQTAS